MAYISPALSYGESLTKQSNAPSLSWQCFAWYLSAWSFNFTFFEIFCTSAQLSANLSSYILYVEMNYAIFVLLWSVSLINCTLRMHVIFCDFHYILYLKSWCFVLFCTFHKVNGYWEEVLFELWNQTTDFIVVVHTLQWRHSSSFDFCPYLLSITWNKFSITIFFKIWALLWIWGMRDTKLWRLPKMTPTFQSLVSQRQATECMLLFLCTNEDICIEFKYASKDQFHKGNILPLICMCRKF
jgi:hypothetical protein